MRFPFAFEGQIRRTSYALWSLGAFFSQHVVVLIVFKAMGEPLALDWWFVVAPLRSLVTHSYATDVVLLLALAYLLILAWALAALSFRRAANANISEWIAAAAVAPIVQVPVILFLCVVPPRVAQSRPPGDIGAAQPGWTAAAQGVVAGMGVTLFAVAVGALVFGTYGYGMFVVSPFVIGTITAYLANRSRDIGAGRTASLVFGASVLGGIALVVAALEGAVCIVLASPLGLGIAVVGGMLGRAIALRTRRSPRQTLSGLALLPLVFGLEAAMPPTTRFDTMQTVEIAASPEAVWNAIVHMDTIDEPVALPFRLGIAYPLRGEVIGEGVGAIRRGEFSTGTAIERVTEWSVNEKLAFVVLEDVPAMDELSPYRHVHAPHVIGYFRTSTTSFELQPRAGGRTRIVERTAHELRLDPVFYWLPLARWVVDANNARVLTHIRNQAERSRVAHD
jgi:uncharacterized membrane protein YhaH (DUF805 family)